MSTGAPPSDAAGDLPIDDDRRRDDRRDDHVRLADYPIPQLRKALLTAGLLLAILGLLVYMIHKVIVALIVGVVLAIYLLPFHQWTERRLKNRTLTAVVVIVAIIVPLAALLSYSWIEIAGAAEYLNDNREEVAAEVTAAVQRLPYGDRIEIREDLSRWVSEVATRATEIAEELQETLDILVLSLAVFLFTVFYVLTDHERIVHYIRARIPGRYRPLGNRITDSVRRVAYGALYATFVTQIMKAGIVLAMNLLWNVPLAVVLAIASFFIGFLPIIGSWSIYVPVAIYVMVFQGSVVGGVVMLLVGFLVNTLFISLYLRPRMAASKSRVLNFYWMFIALVTGVYTFGLVGIIIGPVLIAALMAVFESVMDGHAGDLPDELDLRPIPGP